ncbi:MAG: pentapeptide repeat-containing protein [Thermoguttaceae bacterium]
MQSQPEPAACQDLPGDASRAALSRDRAVRRPCRALALPLVVLLLTINVWVLWGLVRAQRESRLEHHFWIISQPGATAEQRRDAFTTLVRAGNRQWRSARLKFLKLRGADLAGANLEQIDLQGSDLTDASFKSGNLHRANLELTKLTRADFSLANLSEAYLRKVDLTGANLSRSDLRSASLEQSDLIDAVFERADMTEVNLLLAVLTRADLRRVNLSWANLDAADFSGANLEEANLESASMRDAFFGDSNWWRAKGLPSAVIERFKVEFPPGEEASAEFREDYRLWLAGQ